MQEQLCFYNIDMKYIRDLSKVDDNVLSVSPQIDKQNRPFIGILVMINGKQYCAPITSPKPKHQTMPKNFDYIKIMGKVGNKEDIIGVINFNNMIPVHKSVITPIELKIRPNDNFQTQHYKTLTGNQLKWCRSHSDAILKNAQKTYNMIVNGKANQSLKKRCCNFQKLEKVLEKRLSLKQDNISDIDKLNEYKGVINKVEIILSSNPELNKLYQETKQSFLKDVPVEKHAKPIDFSAPISEQLKAAKALRDEYNMVIISDPKLKAEYSKAKEHFEYLQKQVAQKHISSKTENKKINKTSPKKPKPKH